MRQDRRAARAKEIETAAYGVLEEKGYEGLSMLAVARAARASNETLYRWYGDKTGLFRSLIERNAAAVADRLAEALSEGDPLEALAEAGPMLLTMLMGARAVALNRAAVADAEGLLGQASAEGGRGRVAPLVESLAARAVAEGCLAEADPGEIAETWLALLIGDLQIRRVTGAIPEPSPEAIAVRAGRALEQLMRLYPPDPTAPARQGWTRPGPRLTSGRSRRPR